jgi:hypothetical protein
VSDQIVEITLPNKAVALARVADLGVGATKVSALPKFEFQEVTEVLEGLADGLKAALQSAAPDKVTVTLGLDIAVKNGKLSGLIVEGEGTGSLGITLEWQN